MQRVKDAAFVKWVPEIMARTAKVDPTGKVYLFKDRRVLLEFTVDREGAISAVHVVSSSGLAFVDESGVWAMQHVGRVPDPPAALF
jgi:hypothetical protein